jgi:hypothetical protein
LFVGVALLGSVAACESQGQRPEHEERRPVATPEREEPASAQDNGALFALGTPASVKPEERGSCPPEMALVRGEYCLEVEQTCLRYLDPPGRYHHFRCAEYAPPRCVSKARVPLEFCIDRDEYTEPGTRLPSNFRSFTHARKACGAQGKRVCRESEWNFACEGEAMLPYPYGLERDSTACNADHTEIISPDGSLKDLRAPSDAYPRCVSPFGVRNLSGNLEEFVARDGPGPARPAMKGAYWQPSRNFCRAAQTAHDEYYNGIETGFRCCADVD